MRFKKDYWDNLSLPLFKFSGVIALCFIIFLDPINDPFIAIGSAILISGYALALRFIVRVNESIDDSIIADADRKGLN